MKNYTITIGQTIGEDELPEYLPDIMYDWWYDLSKVVGGVRVGPHLSEED